MTETKNDFDDFFGQTIRLSDISTVDTKTPLLFYALRAISFMLLLASILRLFVIQIFFEDLATPMLRELPPEFSDRGIWIVIFGVTWALSIYFGLLQSSGRLPKRLIVGISSRKLRSPFLSAQLAEVFSTRLKVLLRGEVKNDEIRLPGIGMPVSNRSVLAVEYTAGKGLEEAIILLLVVAYGIAAAFLADMFAKPEIFGENLWRVVGIAAGTFFVGYLLLIAAIILTSVLSKHRLRLSNMQLLQYSPMTIKEYEARKFARLGTEGDHSISMGTLDKDMHFQQFLAQRDLLSEKGSTWFTRIS